MHLIPRQNRATIKHRMKILGRTILGMPIEVFLPENGNIKYLMIAGQHGNEPETTVLLSSVLRSISSSSLHCAVVLAANPDGLVHGTRCNAAGVDLNRNFPSSNWSAEKVCYSWNDEHPRDTELSPGTEPASEPETRSLLHIISTLDIKTVIALHSPLHCIDDPEESELAKSISQLVDLPLVSDIGYDTPGSLGSWGRENGVSVITIELPFDTIQNLRRRFSEVLEQLLIDEL